MWSSTTAVATARALPAIGEALESAEPHELVGEAGIGRVAPARVRHDEDPGVADPLRLGPGAVAGARAEERAIHRASHERDDARLEPPDQPRERDAPAS